MEVIIASVMGSIAGMISSIVIQRYGKSIVSHTKTTLIKTVYFILRIKEPVVVCTISYEDLKCYLNVSVTGAEPLHISAENSYRMGISQDIVDNFKSKIELPVLPLPRKAKLIYRNKLGIRHQLVVNIL